MRSKNMQFKDFKEARAFVVGLGLRSQTEWVQYCKSRNKPKDIPSVPERIYHKKGWVSFGDWLGTGAIATRNKQFRSFEDARSFVRSLGLKSRTEWVQYCQSGNKPKDIPSDPEKIYQKKGWVSFGDWLGTGSIANFQRKFRSFEDARMFARSLSLKSRREWDEYCKSGDKPSDIPAQPQQVYKDKGWISLKDWLGTDVIRTRNTKFRSFEDARMFVRSLGLKSRREWVQYCKSGDKPSDIPSAPDKSYQKKGWVSLGDWLGTGSIANFQRKFRSFEDARMFVRSLGLKSRKEWVQYCQSGDKPSDIPSSPYGSYKDKGWISWGDWWGTNRGANHKNYC